MADLTKATKATNTLAMNPELLLKEVETITSATDDLLLKQARLAKDLAVLKQAHKHSGFATEAWLARLPSMINGAQKRLDCVTETIKLNTEAATRYLAVIKGEEVLG